MPGKSADGRAENVTFTPRDIEGLLTLVAADLEIPNEMHGDRYNKFEDTILLKNGDTLQGEISISGDTVRGAKRATNPHVGDWREITQLDREKVSITLANGEHREIPASAIEKMYLQWGGDLRPWEVRDKVLEWSRQGGGVADVSTYSKVYNRPFHAAESQVYTERPEWAKPNAEENKYPADMKREWGELTVEFGDRPRTYRYWVVYDGDQPKDGGWYTGYKQESPPDFMWRPKKLDGVEWPEKLSRNPWVDVALVKRLYQQSIQPE